MFISTFLVSAMMMISAATCEAANSSPASVSIQSAAGDQALGDVYVQDSDGNRAFARVYRHESGRIYCIFPRVVSRGSSSGPAQKYWASQSSKRGFRYEVYYNGKTWYFNL